MDDYVGLFLKYKVNRPLSEEDIARHLRPDQPTRAIPQSQLSIIRMNSTFLEIVDKHYAQKGLLTFGALVVIVGLGYLVQAIVSHAITGWSTFSENERQEEMNLLIFVVVLSTPLILVGFWSLFTECFRYTHYPIRFNRKTRMVHVFRTNGTVMSESWDKLYFSLCPLMGKHDMEVRGYRLAEDGQTVLEAFGLPFFSDDDRNAADGGFMLRQWELIRRYMEDGPTAVIDFVKTASLQDVAHRREAPDDGYNRLLAGMAGPFTPLVCIPFLVYGFTRWLSMLSCRVPQWPKEIDLACQFDHQNDPYIRDCKLQKFGRWMDE